MRKNLPNFVFFLVIVGGLWFLLNYAEKNWLPKPAVKPDPNAQRIEDEKRLAEAFEEREARKTAAGAMVGVAVTVAAEISEDARRQAAAVAASDSRKAPARAVGGVAATAVDPTIPKPPEPSKIEAKPVDPPELIELGNNEGYYNRVLLTTQGGGVQQLILSRFEEADRLGNGVPRQPLYLIPGVPRVRQKFLKDNFLAPNLKPGFVPVPADLAAPAYTVFHYPTPDHKFPDPKLGEMNWKVASKDHPEGGVHTVTFEAELGDPHFVKFRKTYSLGPKDYHFSLKIEIERLPGGEKGKGQLRYQLSGPRGLPVEGEWYTSMFRVALVGWADRKGVARRQYETANEVAAKQGGDQVFKGENTIRYMAVATQFFTSAVAIDDTAEGAAKNPWSYVRATTEVPLDKKSNPNDANFDDVTVRAASDTLDLAAGEKITHSYIVYNGPAKVRLLGLMEGDRAVDPALVKRYQNNLGLNTITDFQSPTWLGTFANTIYWTDLVIAFTNLMHWLLAAIHTVVPNWALCIVVLTVMVRLLLLIPSKKQTAMNLRMMAVQKKLAPQFEELKKKYEGDFHGYNRAKMQLMMAHGVNPAAQLGGCLLLFLQMPVMMGLYFCLQESVFFRLESFLWVENLAAPDMMVWWGEKIPMISTPDGLGGMLYLGPYFNLLPILAVVLMIGQQLKMLPPPTDDQSRQQRMMMKIMMFIMPLMFYKFAAGLALYFIVGSIWGLVERKLIAKSAAATADTTPAGGAGFTKVTVIDAPPKPKGMFGRFREALRERIEEAQRHADEQSRRQIINDKDSPNDGGGQGQPPPRRDNDRRDNDRRDKKKKRRK